MTRQEAYAMLVECLTSVGCKMQPGDADYDALQTLYFLAGIGERVKDMPPGAAVEHEGAHLSLNDGPSWRYHLPSVDSDSRCCLYGNSAAEVLKVE